jgi:hypothetical protein
MLPYQMIAGGQFIPTLSTAYDLSLQAQNPPDFIELRNLGSSASTGWGEASDAQQLLWFWQKAMNQGTAKGLRQTSDASNPAVISNFLAADGISCYDTAHPPVFAPLAGTAITAANPAVISMANTGSIAVGDFVRLTGVTGMQQIAGYTFQVRAVTANTSITLMLDASGFAAAATGVQVHKYIPNRMYPHYAFITGITQAAQGVVSFAENVDFTPGENIGFRVSSDYGMDEINNRTARVLSVSNSATATTVTIDLDTTGFTAFVFPTSAVALAGVSPAVAVPASSGVVPNNGSATVPQEPPGTNLRDSFDNRNTRVIHLGAAMFTDGTQGDVWEWRAMKYDNYSTS